AYLFFEARQLSKAASELTNQKGEAQSKADLLATELEKERLDNEGHKRSLDLAQDLSEQWKKESNDLRAKIEKLEKQSNPKVVAAPPPTAEQNALKAWQQALQNRTVVNEPDHSFVRADVEALLSAAEQLP